MQDDKLLDDLIQQKAENLANMREIERLKARALALLKMVSDLTGQLLNAKDGSALEDTLNSVDALERSLTDLQHGYDHEVNERVLIERKLDDLQAAYDLKPSDGNIEKTNRYIYLLEGKIKSHISGDSGDPFKRLREEAEKFAEAKIRSEQDDDGCPF
jgi:hypothetical protein